MAERTLYFGSTEHPLRVIVDPLTVDQPALAEFLTYWREKRGAQRVPQYAQFSARELQRHLGSVVVTDALPGYSDFRYRLVGSHVTRYLLSDATGKTMSEAFDSGLGQFLIALNRQACVEAIPVRLTGPAAIVDTQFFPAYDTLYAPWASGDVVDKVVSIFAFDRVHLDIRNVDTARLPLPDNFLSFAQEANGGRVVS